MYISGETIAASEEMGTDRSTDLDRAVFGRLMEQSQKYDLLTREQEQELGRKVQAGLQVENLLAEEERTTMSDEERALIRQGLDAREQFIHSNLRLVGTNALAFYHKKPPSKKYALMDIYNDGILGLNRAIIKFDPERGFKFSTYATNWIKQSMQRGLINNSCTIRVPIHKEGEIRKIKKLRETGLDDEEVARSMDMTPEELSGVDTVRALNERMLSLDTEPDDDGRPLENFVSASHQDPSEILAERYDTEDIGASAVQMFLSGFLKEGQMNVVVEVQNGPLLQSSAEIRMWSKLRTGILSHPAIAGRIAVLSGLEPTDALGYQPWRDEAACKTDADKEPQEDKNIRFVSTVEKNSTEAKAELMDVCDSCPVYQQCLRTVAEQRPEMGFWAGVHRGSSYKGSYHPSGRPVTLKQAREKMKKPSAYPQEAGE
jgi:RNA polymerase sigma factor (sigma-70 family)